MPTADAPAASAPAATTAAITIVLRIVTLVSSSVVHGAEVHPERVDVARFRMALSTAVGDRSCIGDEAARRLPVRIAVIAGVAERDLAVVRSCLAAGIVRGIP